MRPVVFVPCPVGEGQYAGWEIQVRRFAMRNSDRFEFRFLYSPELANQYKSKILVVLSSVVYAFRCWRIMSREKRSSSVYFPSFFLPNVILAGMLTKRVHYIVRLSGNELLESNPITYRSRIRMIRRARHVIALNSDQHKELGRLGLKIDRRHMIPNSVEPGFRPPTSTERIKARMALHAEADDWIVGCVGLVCARKQQRSLIAAVSELKRPNAIVVLCGPETDASESDISYADACRSDADRLGVRLVMTGRLDDVREILWALDVFALPSLAEGMPNALLEALACGLPCVGSDIPGIRDLLSYCDKHRLFSAGDTKELVSALTTIQLGAGNAILPSDFTTWSIDERILTLLDHEFE